MRPESCVNTASRTLWVCAALAAFLTCGCHRKEAEAPDVAVTVQAANPVEGPMVEEIAADAILAPLAQAALVSRLNAPIRAEYVKRGDHVRRGQLLVTLDSRDLQGSALESEGTLAAAQASYTATTQATIPEDLRKAESDAAQTLAARDVAVRTSDERKRLYQQGALAGRDADTAFAAAVQAQALYDTARRHLESVRNTTERTDRQAAQAQVQSARGRLLSAEAQVGYANLRSPIEGVVTERPLFPGETASAGTPVITVMDTSSLLAKLHLAQRAAQALRLHRKALIHIPGEQNPVEATVSFISPALDAGSTTVEVWLKLANPQGALKVGTPVHAVIDGETVPRALQVPVDAILPTAEGGTQVMLVGADGLAHKRGVQTGLRTEQTVQVVSGVSAADRVITSGGYGLDDGTKVTVGKPGAAEDKD